MAFLRFGEQSSEWTRREIAETNTVVPRSAELDSENRHFSALTLARCYPAEDPAGIEFTQRETSRGSRLARSMRTIGRISGRNSGRNRGRNGGRKQAWSIDRSAISRGRGNRGVSRPSGLRSHAVRRSPGDGVIKPVLQVSSRNRSFTLTAVSSRKILSRESRCVPTADTYRVLITWQLITSLGVSGYQPRRLAPAPRVFASRYFSCPRCQSRDNHR